MDLRFYYQQIRAIEESIAGQDAVVVSEPTRDGGKGGVFSDVSRALAAKLIVDGKARLATVEEEERYRVELDEARRRIAGVPAPFYSTGRVQVSALADAKKNPVKRG